MSRPLKIVFIGAGNVATHLAPAFERAGIGYVSQVWSRSLESARSLAGRLVSAEATDSTRLIIPDADLYVVSLVDQAVPQLIDALPHNGALWVHTSGSLPMEILAPLTRRYGVFYPLQTFSREVDVDMSRVPLFIEGADETVTDTLRAMAEKLSDTVHYADSELRARMHIAAVWACNFTNYMFTVADDLLRRDGLDLSVLYPLLEETLRKALQGDPASGQTGPAVRGDSSIVARHAATLPPALAELYLSLSRAIRDRHSK